LAGREVELEVARGVVAHSTRPGALLVRGDPGIGKSTIWSAARELAEASGALVLAASAAEVEMPLGFAVLGDLLEPVLADIERLPQPHRRALALAVGAGPAAGPTPDRLATCRAFLAALRMLASERPVVLALDDLQWLDPPSTRVLSFALRRFGEEAVCVLATLRGDSGVRDPLDLRTSFVGDRYRELTLGPLTQGALSDVLQQRIGGLSRSLLSQLFDASGGNPMFALEFARSLPTAPSGRPPHPLAVPASLRDLILDRVTAIPDDVKALLGLAAALRRPTPSLLALALGDHVEHLLGFATDAGLLEVTAAGFIRFTHPLIASAVYGEAPASARRALHRQAASVSEDQEEQARHLALSMIEPNAEVASALEQAAICAANRGAPETAADLAGEAVTVTPASDSLGRHRRVLARAAYLGDASDVRGAQELLDPILGREVPEAMRARALIARSDCEFTDRAYLVDLLRRALDASAGEPEVRWHALIRYAQQGGWVSGRAAEAAAHAREAVEIARALDRPDLLEHSQLLLRYYESAMGRTVVSSPDSFADTQASVRLPAWHPAHSSPGAPLMWAGQLAPAREAFLRQYEGLVERGSVLKLPFLLLFMTELEWRAGDWGLAARYSEEAADILGSTGPAGGMVAAYVRVLIAASAGRVDEARAVASDAIAHAEILEDKVAPFRNRWALGLLELSLGDPARAWQSLEGLPERADEVGVRNPGVYPFLPDVVEALLGLGRLDEAESVLAKLEDQGQAFRHAWATPAALRARGLLLLARGDTEPALSLLDAAAAGFVAIGHPLDVARSYLAAGSALRRAGERSRAAEKLDEALAIFIRLDAPLWRRRCEDELRRARPRPRQDHQLTAAETQVARLVAGGRTNREVGAELFTTVATVEAHLTRIYRKAGVRSRSELTRLVMEGTLPLGIDGRSQSF